MMKQKSLLIAALCLLVSSFDISAETGELTELAELSAIEASAALIPMEVGQVFTYDRADSIGNEWTVQLTVDSKATFDSLEYFHLTFFNYNNDQVTEDVGYVRSTESQSYDYNPDGPDYLQHQIADVGTKWSFYSPQDSGLNYKVIEIVDIAEVTTPFGQFQEAYETRRYLCVDPGDLDAGKSPDWYEWIVPGIGIVKEEDYWADNSPVIMELNQISHVEIDSATSQGEMGLSVVGKKLPTETVSGSGEKVSLTAFIENVSVDAFEKGAVVDIYFYISNIDTGEQIEIGRLEGKSISGLKPGKVKKYSVKAFLPAGVDDGDYEFGASIDGVSAVVENHTVAAEKGFIALAMVAGKVSLPSAVIAGQAAKMAIQVVLSNDGNIRTERTAVADFTVVARPVGGGADIVLYEKSMKFGNVKPGKAKKYSFKPSIPSSVPEGTYDIAIKCVYDEVDVELVLDSPVIVSEPFVDLACDVGHSSASGMILPGTKTKIKVPITISNGGNVALEKSDTVDVMLYLREEGGGQDDVLIGSSLGYRVGGLKNGKPKKLNMSTSMPATVSSGDYRYVVVVDGGSDIEESDEGNNETVSDEVITVAGGFMELTGFNGNSNTTYSSSVKGNLFAAEFSGKGTVEVEIHNGNVTETVTSNDGWDTQVQTYYWYQNSQGIFLGSFGQEFDMGAIEFDFDNLVVFPIDGSTGTVSDDVYGVIEIGAGWSNIDIDLTGEATASGVITGVKKIKVNGEKYDAVESKIKLTIDTEGSITGGDGTTYAILLYVKQDITYWTTSSGIIKSKIKTSVKVRIPGLASAGGSATEVREIN